MKKLYDQQRNRLDVGQKVIAKRNGKTRVVPIVQLGSKHLVVAWPRGKGKDPKYVKVLASGVKLYHRNGVKHEEEETLKHNFKINDLVRLLDRGEGDPRITNSVGRIIDFPNAKVATVLIPKDHSPYSSAVAPVWPIKFIETA